MQRYADVGDLKEAARMEARLGPLVHGLIVNDTEQAARQIAKLETGIKEIWLTASEDPAKGTVSKEHGAFG